METDTKEDKMSAVDKAIAEANKRKGVKGTQKGTTIEPPKESEVAQEAAKRKKLSEEERAAREAEAKRLRLEKKAKRDEARRQREAAREANKKTPHMTKIDRAASKLPSLDDAAREVMENITVNFPRAQVDAIAQHLLHHNRVEATRAALEQKLEEGDTVKIVGGEAKYRGMIGTVDEARRIRCFVNVEGVSKRIYLFTSEVEKIEEMESPKTGTDD